MFFSLARTLVYLEGSASLRDWEDSEGKKQTTLNIVQRKITAEDELNVSDYANLRVTIQGTSRSSSARTTLTKLSLPKLRPPNKSLHKEKYILA